MAENWREKFKEQIISSPDYVGNKTVSDPDWREKMKAAVIDGSAAKAYNAESKRMATEAAYNKKVSQGKSAYEKYLSGTKSDGKKKKSFLDYFANVGYAGDTSLPNGGMSSAVMQIERDHDKPQPINISALSDDQLKDFYYLYAESPEKAKEYVEETNNKNAAIKADERAKWAGKNTGTRILSAVAQAPVSAISMADYLNQLAWYNATGEVYTERNADSPTMLSRSLIGGAAQGLTEKGLFNTGLLKGEIDESIPIVGGMSLGSAYQLGTSMINSAVSAATQGSIGAIFMGGSAASNAFYDALDKGASADQAIYNGLAQGTAEALFEYVSLDNLIKMDVSAPLIKNVLKQGGIEASEEAMTSISNYVTDAIIMKGRSEYAELLEKYNGNKSKAYMAMVNQVAQDAIGGFISGGGLTLINYGTNGVFNSRQTKKAYSPVVQDLVAESLELNPDNKLAKKIQDKINSGKSISGRNITKLINQNEADMQANDRATIQAAAAEQLTKYGESGDVEALAAAITKLTAGENLSRSERALIDNSEYGQRVANELAPENIDSGEYNTGWAETLGTDRINAEAYSRLLQDAQVETEQQPVDTAPVVENIQQSPTVRETAEVTSSETPTSQTVKSSLPASDTQADTKSSVKDLSTKYGKQAGAFIHTYQQGQDIKKYDEAYSNAYDYGRSGVPFSTVKGLEGVAYLTEKQQELAYDAGTAAANDEAVAKAKDRTSRANGKIGRRIGAVKLEGAPASSLNEQQKRATRVLRTVAEATGVDIVLYKSDVNEAGAYEGANGRFDPKSPDKIYIDLNSGLLEDKDANDIGKYAMLRTFSHEFVHFVEFWNSVRYNELRKLVFEEINAHGENVNDLIDTKIEETGLSYERASREVVAEAMTDILPDSKFVQNMAESHKSLFNKLLEKLKEFAADIRAYFKTIGSNRDAGAKALKEQVGETVKYLDSIIDMFDTAATEAVETFQKAYAVDETEQVADKLENAEASTVSEETETAEAEAAQVKPEPKTTTSEHGYTVADNTEYGSVEVKFNDKPSEAVRDVLKANKFRWNKAKKVWYGKTSHDAIVDALNKAYEAESSPEAKSDFMKSWERATQAEKDEQVIGDEGDVQYQARKPLDDELPKKHNKKSTYSETETLFMQWENGSAPIGEVKRFSRFGKFRYYEKTKKGSIELSRDQYNERRKFDAQNTYTRVQRQISEATDYNEGSERNMLGYSDGNRNAGGAGVLSRQTVWETLRHDATGSVRGGVRNSSGNDVNSPVSQAISSAKTSIMQIPALFKHKAVKFGDVNIDIGGGRFDLATNYLASIGTTNLVFDPFNRPETTNASTLDYLRSGKRADTATCANVLNVIAEEEARKNVILEVAKAIKPDGVAYFMVYEGNGTGIGKETSAGYQNNRKTADYVQEISQWFDSVQRSGKLITATKPKANLPKAAWELSPGNAVFYQQRTSPLTDREVLSIAASEVNVEGLTDGERDALNIFKRRLDNLNELEQKRAEEGRKYKEQQFGANVDRAEAQKTLNRMKILDDQIKRASSEVLDVEKKEVLKRVLQRSRKVVEKAEREHGQELLRRYRDRRNNAAAIKKYRDRIVVTSMQLSDWLLKNSDKEHVPEVLKKPVLELLTSIDFSSKRLLSGGQETKADKKFGANLAALNKLLEGQQGAIDGVDNAVDNIGAYLDISAENRQFLNDLVSTVASASSDGTTFTINRMTSEELKNFSHFLKNLSTAIRKANATLANARYENIPSMAQDSMAHMEAMGEARALDGTKLVKLIGWKNATPYYAFKRFGEAGKSLFEGLYKGWGKMAFHQQEILNFTKELYKAKEVRKWRSDIHDITLEDGSKIQMSTAQIMELSMLMKREQALKHINGVGIRIGNIKTKSGIKQDTNYYKLTVGDMDNIKKLLTQRQLKVAQDMQKYMAKRGAEWGNEISMARFGYEFYTEGENYYPIKTDDNSRPMRDTDIQGNSMFRLLNLSASKSLNQYANNALVVGDIFDTFTGHMTDMAKLNALGLPLLDAIKWFNYRERTNNPDGTINEQSLTKSMEKAFGKSAGSYFRTLMKDINGVKESGDRSGDIFNKMLTRYKIAAVAANIRVALLQPTSYVRAQYIIKKRHLLNAFVFKKNGYNEAMKYSGTAVWKSLGYYDTDIARSMRTQIENGDAVLDKVRDWSMGLAELGDKRTWGRLWVACKLQTKSENPRLTGDALCKATAELFDEMIYATQVMDSTLTRSEIMRGTTRADKLVSAFGAEPTLSANIVMDAASEYMIDMRKTDARTAWRKNKDKIALAFTTYVSSAAFAAFVESLWDAVRDDDDYETFLEKFMQAFLGEDGLLSGNLVQDLTIIGKIPELKAIIEVLTGDKSSDMSIASLESISSTYSIWKETIQLTTGELQDPTKVTYYGKMTPWGKIYKTLQALSQISGVAVSNGARDVIAVWNTIAGSFAPSMKLKTYDPGTAGSIKHAYLGGALTETEAIDELIKTGGAKDNDEAYWLVKQWETGNGKYEDLKGAIMANDAAAFNSAMSELTANGVEEKTARSEATSIIGDLFNGTDDEPASINAAQAISMLQRYGGKDSDEANDTVNLWKFKAGDEKYKDISMPAVRKYNEYCAGVGISKDMYFDAWSTINDIHGEDYDGDGKNDDYSAMDKKLSYIDSLSISSSQKTALALANGISEKQINNRAPW